MYPVASALRTSEWDYIEGGLLMLESQTWYPAPFFFLSISQYANLYVVFRIFISMVD